MIVFSTEIFLKLRFIGLIGIAMMLFVSVISTPLFFLILVPVMALVMTIIGCIQTLLTSAYTEVT